METTPHRSFDRRSDRIPFRLGWLAIDVVATALRAVQPRRATGTWLHLLGLSGIITAWSTIARADIPWPEVVQRLAYENEKLARRPQGHNGEYFVVCTLYYTPKESGFTFERGFDATPVTKRGLRGRKYPRDFLRSVKKEGFGRIVTPVERTQLHSLQRRRFICIRFSRYRRRRGFGSTLFRCDEVCSWRPPSWCDRRDRIPGFAKCISQ